VFYENNKSVRRLRENIFRKTQVWEPELKDEIKLMEKIKTFHHLSSAEVFPNA